MAPLSGFRIGVTSDRRADDLIAALERRGAQVLHAPALTIAPNEQDGALLIDTREVILARPDVVLVPPDTACVDGSSWGCRRAGPS